MLHDTVAVYNRVKGIRRRLKAEASDGSEGHISLAAYDKYMRQLIDEQLGFEEFKRLAPFIPDERLRGDGDPTPTPTEEQSHDFLESRYEHIEEYLNEIIGEYEKSRHKVLSRDSISMSEFNWLPGFLGNQFKRDVSGQLREITNLLQKAMLEPLVLPGLDDDDAPRA